MMTIRFCILSILFCGVFAVACGGNAGERPCLYGAPTAIFEGIEGLENHRFEGKEQESVEQVYLPDLDMELELYQSGCDRLEQEFRVRLNEPYELNTPAQVCALHLANILTIVSEKAPERLGSLQQLADAIRADAERLAYNERVQLSNSDYYVQIDKSHQTDSAILSLVFSQSAS